MPIFSPNYYIDGIRAGDRVVLSRAITLVESTLAAHRTVAHAVVKGCLPFSGNSLRVGITGVPGVGKSTFIERFGLHLLAEGQKVAVLAIDPSSRLHRGSILGDKTRMNELAADTRAYIRPSAAGSELGGVARKTRETMLLCEAAGYDVVIIETVGVGQSETTVRDLTDFFLLLLLPNAGDELQGMKRGIVEMADWIAINKADGNHLHAAKVAKAAYINALHLFPAKESGWMASASLCSALTGEGIAELWTTMQHYAADTRNNGYFDTRRRGQTLYWFQQNLVDGLQTLFNEHPRVREALPAMEAAVSGGHISVSEAVEQLLGVFVR